MTATRRAFEDCIDRAIWMEGSAAEIFAKELGIATDIGRSERYPMPLTATALQMFLATSAMGFGRDDDSSVAWLFAQLSRVDLPDGAAS